MVIEYEKETLLSLREIIWERNLIPKRWMLNYIKKQEAVDILNRYSTPEEVPPNYIDVIKKRSSTHRKKVYRSRKDRQKEFGTPLSREERLRKVVNTADKIIFDRVEQMPDGFVSYLGSSRGKTAFIFKDSSGTELSFTRSEVEKLVQMGLYVPRGTLSVARTKLQKPAKSSSRLKDIFGD